MAYGHWGEFLVDIKMHLYYYQKDRTRSRSVSVHSDLTYDASHAHRRGSGDKPKNDIFLLVTTRLIAHSGQSQFLRNCVGEFDNTLVTSKEMSNCSGDHHKAYCTYIHTKVYTLFYMWHMDTGENSWWTSKCIFIIIRRTVLGPGVCLCIWI